MTKLEKGQDIRVETLAKTCGILDHMIDGVMEITPDNE